MLLPPGALMARSVRPLALRGETGPAAYDRRAQELAQMFRENFEKFDDPALTSAGPRF